MPIQAAFMVPHPPMIIPDIGKGSEAQITRTIEAYQKVAAEVALLAPETIIITSPHTVMYGDYFHISPGGRVHGSFADFGVPRVSFHESYDSQLVREICRICEERDFPAGTLGERSASLDHGTMVPLWFIRNRYKGGKIVRIGLSGLPLTDHYRLGQIIQKAVEDLGRRVVFIASGDLSHKLQDYGPYGFDPEGPRYDHRIMNVCGRAAFGELLEFEEDFCRKAAECGHRSFVIMAGALDGQAVQARQLSHEDVTGVGYGICTFNPQGEDSNRHFLDEYIKLRQAEVLEKRSRSDDYVRLAASAIETYVLRRESLSVPASLPREMRETRAGAFVSIHEKGELRGCIGTIGPTAPSLAQEIINNAISAASADPRFSPIRAEELKWLEISVDVLGEPEDIASEDELDVKRYGVIVTSGRKRGLLLPDLDGVDTVRRQVDIAKQKAGIRDGESCRLQRFMVTRHL